MPRLWTISEFEGFYAGTEDSDVSVQPGLHPIPRTYFSALKELLGTNLDDAENTQPVFSLSHHRGLGDVVQARNHVGVVSFADGSQIEILPKLVRSFAHRGDSENNRVRGLLLKMLAAAFDIAPVFHDETDLRLSRLPLLEAFFRTFLDTIGRLAKRGLAGGYVRLEENERLFKGKLLVAEHIRRNLVRRERFYVSHDAFLTDTPANRILRTSLEFVRSRTAMEKNRRDSIRLLSVFEDVPPSTDQESDFAACKTPTRDAVYREAVAWCDVFLRGRSLANLPGTRNACAFLFPMEKVFERYVARTMQRLLSETNPELTVESQTKSIWLSTLPETPKDTLVVQPDIIVRRTDDGTAVAVLDTKWKLLDPDAQHFGVSQSDFYQLAAYQRHHNVAETVLVYPSHDALGPLANTSPVYLHQAGTPRIRVVFFDLDPRRPDASKTSAKVILSNLIHNTEP